MTFLTDRVALLGAAVAAALALGATALPARAAILVDYDDIVVNTVETFDGIPFDLVEPEGSLAFLGATAAFTGFTATAFGDDGLGLIVVQSNVVPCGPGADACLANINEDTATLFDGFVSGTNLFGVDIFVTDQAQSFQIDVVGNSGAMSFFVSGNGRIGVGDLAGLASVTISTTAADGEDYAFDDVITGFTYVVDETPSDVPAPATLSLLAVGLAGLGTMRRRRPV